jgi:hypothetical protein
MANGTVLRPTNTQIIMQKINSMKQIWKKRKISVRYRWVLGSTEREEIRESASQERKINIPNRMIRGVKTISGLP